MFWPRFELRCYRTRERQLDRAREDRHLSNEGEQFSLRIETAEGVQGRGRVWCRLMASDPGRIDFSADVQCAAVYDEAIVVFLALAFILAAILAWVFDLTPQG